MARRARRSRSEGHLYRDGAKRGELRKFEKEYGKEKGKRVYGAVVGINYRKTHNGKNWNQKNKKR